jgi:integrase
VFLAAYGGLRAGEMFGLRAHRVDPLHQKVHIAEIATHVQGHLHVGPPKTRASHRTVPIPRFVAEIIAQHLKTIGAGPDDLVFPAPQGGHVRLELWRRRVWTPAISATGLAPLRPHDLRHTAVSLWIAAGASPKEIAARAGHTSVVTVLDRYGHLLPGHEDKVNDALDEMAREARPALRIVHDNDTVAEISRHIRGMDSAPPDPAAPEEAADKVFRGGRWGVVVQDIGT